MFGSSIVVGHSRCCFGKGEKDLRGACGIGRLIRWSVIEDIMCNEADTVGTEMWDGENFSFMEKRCCMISVMDQLLMNNEDFIKLVRGGIASNFYTVYCVLRRYKEGSWHGEAETLKH